MPGWCCPVGKLFERDWEGLILVSQLCARLGSDAALRGAVVASMLQLPFVFGSSFFELLLCMDAQIFENLGVFGGANDSKVEV